MTFTDVHIWEPDHAGHHLYYVRLVAHRARALGKAVTLHSSSGLTDTDEFRVQLAGVDLQIVEGSAWRHTPVTVKHGLDVFLEADRMLPSLVRVQLWDWLHRRQRRPTVCLLMRLYRDGSRRHQVTDIVKSAAAKLLMIVNPQARVLALVGTFEAPSAARRSLPRWIEEVRDPIRPTRPRPVQPRARLGVTEGERVFLVAGQISRRKGIEVILEAWQLLGNSAPTLLIVGTVLPEVIPVLGALAKNETIGNRIVIHDGYQAESVLDDALGAADCLLLIYSNDGSSGLLASAATLGLPVIAAGNQYICQAVEQYGLGVVVPRNAAALAAAVRNGDYVMGPNNLKRLALETHFERASEGSFASKILGVNTCG